MRAVKRKDLQPGDIVVNPDTQELQYEVLHGSGPAKARGYVVTFVAPFAATQRLYANGQTSGPSEQFVYIQSSDVVHDLQTLVRLARMWCHENHFSIPIVTGMRRNVRAESDDYILRAEERGSGHQFCLRIRSGPNGHSFALEPAAAFDDNGLVDVGRPVWNHEPGNPV